MVSRLASQLVVFMTGRKLACQCEVSTRRTPAGDDRCGARLLSCEKWLNLGYFACVYDMIEIFRV
jgi:hypothetical protein